MDLHLRLVIAGSREDLALAGGDGGIALDQGGSHAAQRLDRQGQGGDVQQQDIFHIAAQHTGLDRRANCHHLIRVNALVRLFAKQTTHRVLHSRHAGHATYQHHLIDLLSFQAGILQRLLDRPQRTFHQVAGELLQLGARQRHHQVLGAVGIRGNVGQVDLGLHHARKLDLGPLRGFAQTLQSLAVLAQVHAALAFELIGQVIHHAHVKVIAAQEGIAAGRAHLEDAIAHIQDRNIEGAAAQVVNGNHLVLLLIQPIGQRRSGWLIDDAQHFQAGNLTRIFCGVALGIVEIGRHGDDRLGNRLAQVGFGVGFELAQDHG